MDTLKDHYEMYKLKFREHKSFDNIGEVYGISHIAAQANVLNVESMIDDYLQRKIEGAEAEEVYMKRVKERKLKAEIESCKLVRKRTDDRQEELENALERLV